MIKEKSLCLKLSEYQREQLFQLLEGCGHCLDDNKPLKGSQGQRPILHNLHIMRYKCDPEKWKNLATEERYEQFLKEMRSKKPAKAPSGEQGPLVNLKIEHL